jgi:hypothetical protein
MGIWGSASSTLQSRFGRGATGEESEPLPLTEERHPASDTPIVP